LAAQAANWLGFIQLRRKAYAQAETNLLSGWEQFSAPTAELTPNERRLGFSNIVSLYQAWGKPDQTVIWQKRLDALASLQANKTP
jgi:hypothetical protein